MTMEDGALNAIRRIPGVSAAYLIERGASAQHPGVAANDAFGPSASVSEAQIALTSAILAAIGQATTDLNLGELGDTIIEAEQGAIVAGTLPGNRAAVILADGKANVGMIRVELRKLRRGA